MGLEDVLRSQEVGVLEDVLRSREVLAAALVQISVVLKIIALRLAIRRGLEQVGRISVRIRVLRIVQPRYLRQLDQQSGQEIFRTSVVMEIDQRLCPPEPIAPIWEQEISVVGTSQILETGIAPRLYRQPRIGQTWAEVTSQMEIAQIWAGAM